MKNKEINLAKVILKKLQTFQKMGCETEMTLLQKTGDTEQLGICDIGESDNVVESKIKVILMTLASERTTVGEMANNMELGNNAECYIEFTEIGQSLLTTSKASTPCCPTVLSVREEQSNIRTGDRVVYQKEEYIIFEILPIVMGETLLCRQYKAKKIL